MTLRVGIISANWGAYAHLPAWQSVNGVEVTAICTSRRETAEAAAARHGLPRAFWDAEEMAADPDVDIVDIGTRPNLRHDMVMAAFRHGKHIYCGVPMAHNLAAARHMHAAWRASGTTAVVDAFSQWIPQLAQARRMLDNGQVGRPLGGSCRFNMALFNRADPAFPYNWFSQGGLGVSAMRNNGGHLLHYLIYLLGPIAELVADDRRLVDLWTLADGVTLPAENNDCANLLLRFESGLILPIQVSWIAADAEGWTVDIWGTEGRIVSQSPIFPTSRDCRLFAGRGGASGSHIADLQPVAIDEALRHDPAVSIDADHAVQPAYPMALAMHNMVEAIHGRGIAAPDFDQAWQVERTLEAIKISSQERRWVSMSTIG